LKRENCIDLSTIEITESYNILQGTRSALYANDRESISVTVQEVTPRTVGALIALYERAVGIYASLVNINAYHQPGMLLKTKYCSSVFIKLFCCMYLFVDFVIYRCGGCKKAAGEVLALQKRVLTVLNEAAYVISYLCFYYCL